LSARKGANIVKIDLGGKVVLVTGASRGIGRAIAAAMIDSGASVAVHFNRNKKSAEDIAAGGGDRARVFQADLSDPVQGGKLLGDVVDEFGRLDVLVNNAGVAVSSPLEEPLETCARTWHQILSVNLVAAGILSREAIRHFQTIGGGRIVFVASRAAFRGDTPEHMAYAASKGGMVALSRSIARGFGKDGVKSFVVAPGFTRTEMAEDFIEEYGEEMAMKDIALDRMTEPGDIAPMVVFLASGLADHATGATIDINAGSYVR
jgi:NAD(P)-dependent dehydrogenase (short-subunit alcohol dehydrogenase family)